MNFGMPKHVPARLSLACPWQKCQRAMPRAKELLFVLLTDVFFTVFIGKNLISFRQGFTTLFSGSEPLFYRPRLPSEIVTQLIQRDIISGYGQERELVLELLFDRQSLFFVPVSTK